VWPAHIRPTLSDRRGAAWFVGVPEGRNYYYDLVQHAKADPTGDWGAWGWHSDTVLPAEEIESARRDLDDLVFRQEYGGEFVAWQGQAYYAFSPALHCRPCAYDPAAPLLLCFDFNVSPGVCAVCQRRPTADGPVVEVVGEVWIPRNSNTQHVCRKLLADWGDHAGAVICYGDPSGGATGSAKVQGSDWDIIRAELRPAFGARLSFRVPRQAPRERARVNTVNSRLRNSLGECRLFVDPQRAPHVVKDLDGVAVLEGGSGEIDKRPGKAHDLTHISDALGYFLHYEWGVGNPQRIYRELGAPDRDGGRVLTGIELNDRQTA